MLNQPLLSISVNYRRLILIVIYLSAFLFCFPFILTLVMDAGFLSLANEPLAYRYFYSERIFAGESLAVGVGYLISILHHFVFAAMHFFPSVDNSTLQIKLNSFALLTNFIISLILCMILYFAVKSPHLKVIDYTLLCFLTLTPIYGTGNWGFYYTLTADYNFLNIVICIATLFIFQSGWRNSTKINYNSLILLSIFVGVATANKITMLVVTSVVLVPAIFSGNCNWQEIYKRCILSIQWIIISFFSVYLASYLGSPSKMRTGFHTWRKWAFNPGGEPAFWDNIYTQIADHNLGFMMLFSLVVLISSVSILFINKNKRNLKEFMVTIYCVVAFLACFYFIYKRPAGSTLFESSIFLLTLASVLLTVFSDLKATRYFLNLSFFIWFFLALATFQYTTAFTQIAISKKDSNLKWAVFENVRSLAGDLPIEIIFPDNSFHHEGPFELLLKGASVFPSSWEIDLGQKTVIDRYAPRMTFRNNSSELKPEMPYADRRVLVWFDKIHAKKLEDNYQELNKILSKKGVIRIIPDSYSNVVIMHIAVIP